MSMQKKLRAALTAGVLTFTMSFAAPAVGAPADPTPGGSATVKSSSGDTRTEQLTKVKQGKQPGRALSVAPGKTTLAGPRVGPQFISCWDIWFSGPTFHIICDSDQWYSPFVDCSDGFRYWTGFWFLGPWEFFLNCPEGTVAVAGGIFY